MNKSKLTKNMPKLLFAFMCLSAAAIAVSWVVLEGYRKGDITGHWRICRYTLEGINPYPLIGEPALLDSIGPIREGFSTVPWSCVFGSVFYGGFLPLNVARVYIFALHFVAVAVMDIIFYKKYKDILERKQAIILLLLPLVHFCFMYSICHGNAGGIICCLLMIAFLIGDKHPYVAGVLLGFAMMKPQISAIICLVYLFKKSWKILFTAAGIVIAGFAVTCVVISTGPVELLMQTLSSGTAESEQYLGLLNNLKFFGVDSKIILLMNVALGCAYTFGLYIYLKKNINNVNNSLFVFVPACIASTFWIYKNGTDYLIIVFAAAFFCLLCMNREMRVTEYLAAFFSIGWLQMSRCAVYLGVTIFEDNLFIRDLFKSADGLIIAVIGIYLCRLWVKYNGEGLLPEGLKKRIKA